MTEDSTTPTAELPTYGSKPTRPGMYLGLFHGRDKPREAMNDWGFNGPLIGPLEMGAHHVHLHDLHFISIGARCAPLLRHGLQRAVSRTTWRSADVRRKVLWRLDGVLC